MTIIFTGSENVYTDKLVHYCDVFFPHKLQELITVYMQISDAKPFQKTLCIRKNIIRMSLRTVM